jgi:Polysaccharide lyase
MARTASKTVVTGRLPRLAASLIATLAIAFAAASPAAASTASGTDKGAAAHTSKAQHKGHRGKGKRAQRRRARARRHRAMRIRRRAGRSARLSRAAVVSRPRVTKSAPGPAPDSGVLDAGFENGLLNWNTAGVGEAIPSVVNDNVRSGAWSCRVALSGDQDRSELILGGTGGGSTRGMVEFHEGDEYWYGFSFEIDSMVYGEPGAHNLIMQFKGDDDGSPAFGLQLWDYEGDDGEYAGNPKGLWSHGPAMDGDRFLAPVAEHQWHDVTMHFKASGSGDGFYELYLDGQLIDARSGVSMIASGASMAYIKDGLYRNGGAIPGTSEIHLDAARLGHSSSDVAVG